MNICTFSGRLVRNPELKALPTGAKVVNFSLAINSPRKTKDGTLVKDTSFLDFEAWDSGAELIAAQCIKGDALSVICSAKNDKWTTPDGQTRTKTKFRVNSFEQIRYGNSRMKPSGESSETSPVDEIANPAEMVAN